MIGILFWTKLRLKYGYQKPSSKICQMCSSWDYFHFSRYVDMLHRDKENCCFCVLYALTFIRRDIINDSRYTTCAKRGIDGRKFNVFITARVGLQF